MIHIVVGKVVAANGVAKHRAHQSFHHALRRVSKQETGRAIGAVSADRTKLSQLLQVGNRRSVGADCEAHPGNEDAVEEAFQDRGKPLVPNRVDEDQSFRRQQTIGIGRNRPPVERDVMVLYPLLLPMTGSKDSA